MEKQTKALIISFLFFLITGIILYINYYPHYYAFIKTPKGYAYSGQASWFDPWDINNYFAAIKLTQKTKHFLLDNINTTEPTKSAFIYPLYTAAGILFPKADGILLYQCMAVAGGVLLVFGLYVLNYLLIKNALSSLLALLLVALGGGFGFLFPSSAADLNIPGVTFLSSFQKPHEAVAALLYLSSLVFFYLSVKPLHIGRNGVSLGGLSSSLSASSSPPEGRGFCKNEIMNRNRGYLLMSLLTLVLLIPIYPYRILSYFLIVGAFVFIISEITKEKHLYIYLGIIFAIILPLALIYIFHFLSAGFASLISYNPSSISLLSLLLGYGVFIIIYAYQLFFENKKGSLEIFLNLWIVVSLGLSCLPFGMGRLYLSGLLFPMTILLVLTIPKLSARLQIPAVYIMIIVLLVSIPSSFYIFDKRIAEVKNNNIWYYLPASIKQGLDFLGNSEKDGVLVLPPLSSFVPVFSVKHVYFGHKDQTPGYINKINQAIIFYSGKLSEDEAKTFLKDNYINYVVVSLSERQFGKLSYSFLASVYKNESLEIFSFLK